MVESRQLQPQKLEETHGLGLCGGKPGNTFVLLVSIEKHDPSTPHISLQINPWFQTGIFVCAVG